MRTVILVPRREGFADRDRLWAFCKKWWQREFPDWPIYEGHHDLGLFNRSAAINIAASLAGEWDVAVIIDSDVLTHPPNVRWAVETAHREGQMAVPFEVRHNVTRTGTERILNGYAGSWKTLIQKSFREQHSAVIAVPRRLYDAIGGFDEGFRGWGLEDTAFKIACEVIAKRDLIRHEGEVWHLYHAAAEGKHGTPSHTANVARAQKYRTAQANGDAEAIQALVAEGRASAAVGTASGIPHILHRVVPERTPDIAEVWWDQWSALHPGWQMLTHRDPLNPEDYPLTAEHWPKERGARLADLVRLEVLLRYGGVYVDMDMQPFRSLEPLTGAQVFAAYEDERVIPNAIIGARQDHPAIHDILMDCIRSQRKNIWEGGPGATTRVLGKRKDVLLLPPESFYDVHYRDPERDTKMQAKPAPWVFARHHYWGSWLPEERRKVPA